MSTMSFEQLIDEAKKIPFEEKRADKPDLFEVVVTTAQLGKLSSTLEQFYGPPKKPAGDKPDEEAKELTKPYGGIEKNQTLYFIQEDALKSLSMIWPWGDGSTVTVKIYRMQS